MYDNQPVPDPPSPKTSSCPLLPDPPLFALAINSRTCSPSASGPPNSFAAHSLVSNSSESHRKKSPGFK